VTLGFLDFETRSPENLKTAGLDRYMTRAQATIASWAVGDGPVYQWDMLHERVPQRWVDFIHNPNMTFIAHNAPFDRAVMERLLLHPTPPNRWWCTRAQAYAHSLPGGLDALCTILGVPQEHAKIMDGKRLIQLFCVPNKDGYFNEPKDYPDEWTAFKDYAMRDVDALRSIYRRLPIHNFRAENLRYFWLDLAVNERGFAVDVPLAAAAAERLEAAKAGSDLAIARATKGAVSAVTQRDKLLEYLQRSRPSLKNLRRDTVEKELAGDWLSPEDRFLLQARLEGSKASGAKYKRALQMHVDERLRYTMQVFGAGATGRTAHKGFQPGNTPRPVSFNPLAEKLADQHVPVDAEFIDEIILPAIRSGNLDSMVTGGVGTACAVALRHVIVATGSILPSLGLPAAGPKIELVVADYRNIESVVLAWVADETWKLTAFRAVFFVNARDMYRLLYSKFFGRAVESISDHERQVGKVIELSCGFGGSVGAFVTMAATYGMDLSLLPALVLPSADEGILARARDAHKRSADHYSLSEAVWTACHVLVQAYRSANPAIDKFKRDLGRAVQHVLMIRGSLKQVGRYIRVWADANVLTIELPSGRRLLYWRPKVEVKLVTDPETGEEKSQLITIYERARGPKMIKHVAWPGLFVENVVQAIANDVLRAGLLEVERRFPETVVLHVHDEIVCETDCDTMTVKDLEEAMCVMPPWAKGLPVAAKGWHGPRYGKR
jgi:DNA polymerase bacteriophage-type